MHLKETEMRFKPFGRAVRQGDRVTLNCFAEIKPGLEGEENLEPATCIMVNPKKTGMEVIAEYDCAWFTARVQQIPNQKNIFHASKILRWTL